MKLQGKIGPYGDTTRFAALIAAWVVFALRANALYLRLEWNRQGSFMADEAVVLTSSLEALIHPEHVATLEGEDSADKARRYDLVKSSLSRLPETDNEIQYAFIIAAQGEQFVYLADALPESDPDAMKPGDVCAEATDAYWTALNEGTDAFIPETTDARGTWVRVLVPVKDATTGASIALFGVDFDAQLWHERMFERMRPEFLVSLCLIFVTVALVFVYAAFMRLKAKNKVTAAHESILHNLFEQVPIGIAISSKTHVVNRDSADGPHVNQMFATLLGENMDELIKLKWRDLPVSNVALWAQFDRFMAGEATEFTGENEFLLPDGRHARLALRLTHLEGPSFQNAYLALVEDVTLQREAEAALRESERSKALLLSHLQGMAYRCLYDREWTMEFVSEGCVALTGYQPDELIGNRVLPFNEVIAPAYREPVWNKWTEALARDGNFRFEYEIINKSGELRWVYEVGKAIRTDSGKIVALEGIIVDITARKEREREIAYLNEHDQLTGVYDRRYMVEAAARLDAEGVFPVSVVVCDINGVRMVNFAFGNNEGDRLIADMAAILSACCWESVIISRTGGDEFTLILPGVDLAKAGRIAQDIEEAVGTYNRAESRHPYELSISVGYDAKESPDVRLDDVVKAAGESLIHAKLLNHKSSHSAILSSIMATLYARNQETEEHGRRLGGYARMIGEALGMSSKELDELQLLSMLHDIGKIGIDDRVLMKPGALTDEEREEMKKHSEIGHRIALSSPELEHIADYILHHHEKWDGSGYPGGLAGEEIPLPSRILAVCDAYDAMTEDRVYRRAMPKETALREIARCAGAQFDPMIAALFIRLMEERGDAGGAAPEPPPKG